MYHSSVGEMVLRDAATAEEAKRVRCSDAQFKSYSHDAYRHPILLSLALLYPRRINNTKKTYASQMETRAGFNYPWICGDELR